MIKRVSLKGEQPIFNTTCPIEWIDNPKYLIERWTTNIDY